MSPKPTLRRGKRPSRAMIIGVGVLVVVIAAVVFAMTRPKPDKDPYRFGDVDRGSITRSVSASGNLQALVTVDVGSQISGQITQIMVDFNDRVKRGQVMARLDPQTFQSRVAQGQADVAAGQASVQQAEATAANTQADFDRKKTLVAQGIYSPAVMDQATAANRTAQSAVTAARARVRQSQATLRSSQVDLGRTTIVAPIDGVVIDRKVEPGNTVAASLSSPVLFTIAQDLSQLEVSIKVDEADVGQVKEGQMVRFTVDAFPEDTFDGVVTQVRKQPTTEQNVVAYTVIAEAENPQGKLLPGMTANADIVIETRRNVVTVPVAALRWSPPDQNPQAQRAGGAGFGGPPGGGVAGPPGGGGQRRAQGGQGGGQGGGMMGARLVEQLGLDASQKARWDALQTEMRGKIQSAMAAAGGDRTKMRAAMQKNMQDALTRLEPSLRPEQKQKLVVLRATLGQGGRGGGGGGPGGMTSGVLYVLTDGKPSPVPVRVGATDGTSTEVQGIQPGAKVIIGGGPKAKPQLRSPLGGGGGRPGGGGQMQIRM